VPEEPRPPVAIRVTRPQENEDEFLEQELETLTRTSVTLLGVQPRPQGVVLRFEIVLASGAIVLRGEGRVVGFKPNALHGLGGLTLRFTRLDSKSKTLVDKAAALREKRRPSHMPAGASTPPPAPEPPRPPPLPKAVDIDVEELGLPKSVPPPRARMSTPAPSPVSSRPARASSPAPAPTPTPSPATSTSIATSIATATPTPTATATATAAPAGRDALLDRLRARAKRLDPADIEKILSRQRQA
jgi:molecular chaperone DnaK